MMTIDEFNFAQLSAPPLAEFLTVYDVDRLYAVATSIRYAGNVNKKYKAIKEILTPRGFIKLAAGTNRICYRHQECDSIVIKTAIDSVGVHDTPREFINQSIFQPFVTKVFEVTPCGTVGLFERGQPITSREEFMSIASDVYELIARWFTGEYVLEDIGSKFFMNWSIRLGFGPILHDFPYVYKLDGKKLFCSKPDPTSPIGRCDGYIDYDDGYNFLYCKKCGARYRAHELEQGIKEKLIIEKGRKKDMRQLKVYITDNAGNIIKSNSDQIKVTEMQSQSKITRKNNQNPKKKKKDTVQQKQKEGEKSSPSVYGAGVNDRVVYLGPCREDGNSGAVLYERFELPTGDVVVIDAETIMNTEIYGALEIEYNEQHSSFTEKIKELESNLAELRAAQYTEDEEDDSEFIQEMQEEINELKALNNELNRDISEYRYKLSKLPEQNESSENESRIAGLEETIEGLKKEKETLTEEVTNLRNILYNINYTYDITFYKHVEETDGETEDVTHIEQFKSKDDLIIPILSNEIKKSYPYVELLKKYLESKRKAEALKDQVSGMEKLLQNQGDNDEQIKELMEKQAAIEQELEEAKRDLEHVESDNVDIQQRYKKQLDSTEAITVNYTKLTERFNKMIDEHEQEREELSKANASLRGLNANLDDKIKRLEEQLEDDSESKESVLDQYNQLVQIMDGSQKGSEVLREKISELEKKLIEKEDELQEAKDDIERLTEALNEDLETDENEEDAEEIDKLREELKKKSKQLERCEEDNKIRIEQMSILNDKLLEKEKELDKAQTELIKLKNGVERKETEVVTTEEVVEENDTETPHQEFKFAGINVVSASQTTTYKLCDKLGIEDRTGINDMRCLVLLENNDYVINNDNKAVVVGVIDDKPMSRIRFRFKN